MSKTVFTWNGKALPDLTREELIEALEVSMATKEAMIREGIGVHQVQGAWTYDGPATWTRAPEKKESTH